MINYDFKLQFYPRWTPTLTKSPSTSKWMSFKGRRRWKTYKTFTRELVKIKLNLILEVCDLSQCINSYTFSTSQLPFAVEFCHFELALLKMATTQCNESRIEVRQIRPFAHTLPAPHGILSEEKLDVTPLATPVTGNEMHSTHQGLTFLKTESIFSILSQKYQLKIR